MCNLVIAKRNPANKGTTQMMDLNVTFTIVFKSIIAILLASGGIVAIIKGAQLYTTGMGLKPERSTLEIAKTIEMATTSIGGALMLTAVVWGWLAVHEFQRYSSCNGGFDVKSN